MERAPARRSAMGMGRGPMEAMMARKSAELAELDLPELVERLAEAKDTHFKLRIRNATGQLDNTAELRRVRREIARINTFLRQREIAAAEAPDEGARS